MILATLEGNLSGFQSIALNNPVELAQYVVKFYFKEKAEDQYIEFFPPFPYFKREKRVIFNLNNDYISLLLKVDVVVFDTDPGDCRPVGYCDECVEMNKNWKNIG